MNFFFSGGAYIRQIRACTENKGRGMNYAKQILLSFSNSKFSPFFFARINVWLPKKAVGPDN
jgi:hypothetical protein